MNLVRFAVRLGLGFAIELGVFWIGGRVGIPSVPVVRGLGFVGGLLTVYLVVRKGSASSKLQAGILAVSASVLLLVAWHRGVWLRVYMHGVGNAILAAAPIEEWQALPGKLADTDGRMPLRVSTEQLPKFVRRVFPSRDVFCAVAHGSTPATVTLHVWWRDVGMQFTVDIGEPSQQSLPDLYRRRLAERVALRASRD